MKAIINTLVAWGPAGVFLLAVLDSMGIPIPGGVDALLVVVSVLDPSSAYTAAGAAVIGSLVGSMVLFFIARKGGEAYLNRFTSHGKGARLKAWFLEFGLLTIFVPALVIVPLPMKIFVLSAGALDVSPFAFLAVMSVARLLRYFGLAWLGTKLGSNTLPYLEQHWIELGAFAVGLFAVLYVLIKVLDRKHRLAQVTRAE